MPQIDTPNLRSERFTLPRITWGVIFSSAVRRVNETTTAGYFGDSRGRSPETETELPEDAGQCETVSVNLSTG